MGRKHKLSHWLIEKIGNRLMADTLPTRKYLCDFGRICYEIRPADVLLIEGRNMASRIIQNITQSPWSHAALYIGRIHDIEDPKVRELIHCHYQGPTSDQLLVESIVGKGTMIRSIKAYKDEHIRICRPAGLSQPDAQKVVAFAVSRAGKAYNMRHFFDLGRFLLGSRWIPLPRTWQSSLFRQDPGQARKDICSAMLAEAFDSIKFPILPLIREDNHQHLELIRRNPKLFIPSDFDYSPYFNIIKYPIFAFSHQSPYKDLPWNERYISDDQQGLREPNPNHSAPTPSEKET